MQRDSSRGTRMRQLQEGAVAMVSWEEGALQQDGWIKGRQHERDADNAAARRDDSDGERASGVS